MTLAAIRRISAKQLSSVCAQIALASERNSFRTINSALSGVSHPVVQRSTLLVPQLKPVLGWRSLVTLEQAQGQIDKLNDKFVEARDEIEFAEEDAETTYFNESHKTAKDSVGEVLALYQEIQTELTEADKGKLQRSMGMKMEQLKAELGQLDTLHS